MVPRTPLQVETVRAIASRDRPKRAANALPAALALFAAFTACGGDAGEGGESAAPGTALFVAFERDFQGYRSWTSFPVADAPAQGLAHAAGPRTVYVNKRPAAAAPAFPVGTIVVKELGSGAAPDRQVFAMVKRGGGYNPTGAHDWEWFELHDRSDGGVTILWRGAGPPEGETYGGNPAAGGCNECHGAAATTNDYVLSAALRLQGGR